MSFKTTNKYKGWTLVETSHNYFSACKGNLRVPIGSIRRGDREDLTKRFKAVVDKLKGMNHGIEN